MTKKTTAKNKLVAKGKGTVENEDYIPENVFARIKSFWFFNRPNIRQIPYIQDLEGEAVVLYLLPGLLISLGLFIRLLTYTEIDIVSLILLPLQRLIEELIAILAFLIVLFIFMRIVLPGFPKESHAKMKMVFVSFSYIYFTKIILATGFFIWAIFNIPPTFGLETTLYFVSFYAFSVYFVIVSAFSVKSLTGIGLINSLIGGFFLYFTVMIIFIFL